MDSNVMTPWLAGRRSARVLARSALARARSARFTRRSWRRLAVSARRRRRQATSRAASGQTNHAIAAVPAATNAPRLPTSMPCHTPAATTGNVRACRIQLDPFMSSPRLLVETGSCELRWQVRPSGVEHVIAVPRDGARSSPGPTTWDLALVTFPRLPDHARCALLGVDHRRVQRRRRGCE